MKYIPVLKTEQIDLARTGAQMKSGRTRAGISKRMNKIRHLVTQRKIIEYSGKEVRTQETNKSVTVIKGQS